MSASNLQLVGKAEETETLDHHLFASFAEFRAHAYALNHRAKREWRFNSLNIPVVGVWRNPFLSVQGQDVVAELLSYLQHHVLAMPYIWLVGVPVPTAEFQEVSFTDPAPVRWRVEFHNLEPGASHNRHIKLIRDDPNHKKNRPSL